jgi:hypothetical protein
MKTKFRVYDTIAKEWVDGAWMYQNGELDHDTILNPSKRLVARALDYCASEILKKLS